ncbi:hypothetical protein [Helicobacter hepaticus]|jgi:hypothetical protein|uniref:Uncharacterized protein n=6 Tax=Helicobacteraceae TaxID=72293 RepID=Q7VG69_HELHP|nr:hypothetical protein [Helicobacter hepaticus]AAP78052.1 hypothetical protein HH_1455 [Helicobacter hepaticus ATCC 51449]
MNGNWSNFPYMNDSDYFQREKIKQEEEQRKFLYRNEKIVFYQIGDTLEIMVQGIHFRGNGSDIGMGVIGSIFAAISEGIEQLYKKGYISQASKKFSKWTFILEGYSLVFVYNQGTKEWYRGLASVGYEVIVYGITASIIGLISASWWLALIIAAFIAFIAALFATSKWGKSALELISEKIQELAETIKANLEKAKAFFEANEQDYYKPFRNKDFMKNLCEDLTCKDFSEQSLRDLLAYSGYKRDNNEWQTFVYYHTRLSLQDIFDRENGTFKASYKAMRDTAFERGVESQKEARLTYNASKPKITSV